MDRATYRSSILWLPTLRKIMKLRTITEAAVTGLSRRDFLRHAAAAAVTLSPFGRFLAAHGVQPEIAKKIASGSPVPFTIGTGTQYGRGIPPDLIENFGSVENAVKLVQSFGSKVMGFGVDEDAYFTGRMAPQDFAKILQAADPEHENNKITINGQEYTVVEEEDTIYLEVNNNPGYIKIYKNGLPDYIQENPIEGNPLKTWWDEFGHWGEEPICPAAEKVMREKGITKPQHRQDDDFHEPEEKPEPESQPKKWQHEPTASSMHQWFESKLARALA